MFGDENFEIKILDEVFLCNQCQSEISIEDSRVSIQLFKTQPKRKVLKIFAQSVIGKNLKLQTSQSKTIISYF